MNGFIADPDPDEALSQSDRIRAHRGFDRRLLADQEEDLHDVARGLDERYKQQRGAYNPFGGSGESENIPQRMLMPSVEDANLWMLRVKVRFMAFSVRQCANYRSLGASAISFSRSFARRLRSNTRPTPLRFSRHSTATLSLASSTWKLSRLLMLPTQ